MGLTLQVLYPVTPDTTFDYDYYEKKHMVLVGELMGPHASMVMAAKGNASGPDVPPAYYAIATIVFDSPEKMQAAMANAGQLTADIPNYTNVRPEMLIGETVG